MSQIKRTNEVEKYNTTAGWLNEFFSKAARNAPPAPPIVTATKEKFATIEEKMADIRSRVGFSSISGITKESSSEKIVESSKGCACGKLKKDCACNNKIDDEKIQKLKIILKYISDMLDSEPYLLEPEIIAKCMENKDLDFESLKIRPKKLKNFISKKKKLPNKLEVIYVRPEVETSQNIAEDMADYYRHSMPNLF
jgi:hypothetical protein